MNTPKLILTMAIALTASASTIAQSTSGKSLSQSRMEILKSTAPGIVIIEDKPWSRKPDPVTPIPASAPAPGASADATASSPLPKSGETPAAAQATSLSLSERLGQLLTPKAPSGQSLDSAKQLRSADQGFALPTANTGPSAKGSGGSN